MVSGNGKIIDPRVDAAVQQAMQQQIQVAIMQIEHRDQFAMAALKATNRMDGHFITVDDVLEAYRVADLMLRVRMEKPSEPSASEPV